MNRAPILVLIVNYRTPALTLQAVRSIAAEVRARADDLFEAVLTGRLRVRIGATYPLSAAADAHRALESRGTTGKVLLVP